MNPVYTIKAAWALFIAACVAVVLIFAVVQTVRLDGFKFLFWEVEGAIPRAERLEGEIAAILKAQREAREAQIKVNKDAEKKYSDIGQGVDANANAETIASHDATEQFIAAGGVRPQSSAGCPGGAGAATGHLRPTEPQAADQAAKLDAAPSNTVSVTPDDVRICTANTLTAEAGQAFALGLEAASTGEAK